MNPPIFRRGVVNRFCDRWKRAVICILLLMCGALAGRGQSVVEFRAATVKRTYGAVQVVGKDGSAREAYVGANLSPGETLKTGKDGSVEVELSGSGAMRVEADSEVKAPEKTDKVPPQESLQLLKGKLFLSIDAAALKKQGVREFRLKTPALLLAVKGTRFFAAISATGETAGVHRGEVAAIEPVSKQTQMIHAGMAVEVTGNRLSVPRRLQPNEVSFGAIYPGGPVSTMILPIGDGKMRLILGCAVTQDGRQVFKKHGDVIVSDDYQREAVQFAEGHSWRNLALDDRGEIYASCANGGYNESAPSFDTGEIRILPALGGKDKSRVFLTVNVKDDLKYIDDKGREIRGFWGGPFAFGRSEDGALDVNTLYLASGNNTPSTIWRMKRIGGKWNKPEHLFTGSLWMVGIVATGPNEVYFLNKTVFGVNGLDGYILYRLTNWKDPVRVSPISQDSGLGIIMSLQSTTAEGQPKPAAMQEKAK